MSSDDYANIFQGYNLHGCIDVSKDIKTSHVFSNLDYDVIHAEHLL